MSHLQLVAESGDEETIGVMQRRQESESAAPHTSAKTSLRRFGLELRIRRKKRGNHRFILAVIERTRGIEQPSSGANAGAEIRE